MSKSVMKPKIGQLVYKTCQPMKPAQIIKINPKSIELKYQDGTTEEVAHYFPLKDFMALIEEHERKFKKFKIMADNFNK